MPHQAQRLAQAAMIPTQSVVRSPVHYLVAQQEVERSVLVPLAPPPRAPPYRPLRSVRQTRLLQSLETDAVQRSLEQTLAREQARARVPEQPLQVLVPQRLKPLLG